jgi:hypothetical protein
MRGDVSLLLQEIRTETIEGNRHLMITHLFTFALALTLTTSLLNATDLPDSKPLQVTGNSVQSYVDVAAAASCLKTDAKELLKDYVPTFNTAGIEDIRPHRFNAIYDDGVRVYEYLALWVRTQSVSNGADPFAPMPTSNNQKSRLFLIIMVRVKYEGSERWGIQHYRGEPPGALFEAAVLELTESKNTTEAADRFCREWAMLPQDPATPTVPLKGIPHSNPRWLVNVLFVKDP